MGLAIMREQRAMTREMGFLGERITRLEVRVENLTERVDELAKTSALVRG